MNVFLLVCLFVTLHLSTANEYGRNYTTIDIIDEGNLSASISGNEASGSISQSSVMNSDSNRYINQFLGGAASRSGDNYYAKRQIVAGNVLASLKHNAGNAKIYQASLANNNKNLVMNQYGGNGNQSGNSHGSIMDVRAANVHALIRNAWRNNTVRQMKVFNDGANEFVHKY